MAKVGLAWGKPGDTVLTERGAPHKLETPVLPQKTSLEVWQAKDQDDETIWCRMGMAGAVPISGDDIAAGKAMLAEGHREVLGQLEERFGSPHIMVTKIKLVDSHTIEVSRDPRLSGEAYTHMDSFLSGEESQEKLDSLAKWIEDIVKVVGPLHFDRYKLNNIINKISSVYHHKPRYYSEYAFGNLYWEDPEKGDAWVLKLAPGKALKVHKEAERRRKSNTNRAGRYRVGGKLAQWTYTNFACAALDRLFPNCHFSPRINGMKDEKTRIRYGEIIMRLFRDIANGRYGKPFQEVYDWRIIDKTGGAGHAVTQAKAFLEDKKAVKKAKKIDVKFARCIIYVYNKYRKVCYQQQQKANVRIEKRNEKAHKGLLKAKKQIESHLVKIEGEPCPTSS